MQDNLVIQVNFMKAVKLCVALLPLWVAIVPPAHAQVQTMRFQCEQGEAFEAQVSKEQAKVKFASGRIVELLPVDAREGRKFSNGRMLLRLKGAEASVEMNYTLMSNQCFAQESPAAITSSN